jgi:hypothetical protein
MPAVQRCKQNQDVLRFPKDVFSECLVEFKKLSVVNTRDMYMYIHAHSDEISTALAWVKVNWYLRFVCA